MRREQCCKVSPLEGTSACCPWCLSSTRTISPLWAVPDLATCPCFLTEHLPPLPLATTLGQQMLKNTSNLVHLEEETYPQACPRLDQ